MKILSAHVRELLSAYLHGELQPEEVRRVEQHLETCSGCRGEYEQVRKGALLAARLAGLETPPDWVWSGIEQQLRSPRPALAASRRLTYRVAAGVLVVLGLGALIGLLLVREPGQAAGVLDLDPYLDAVEIAGPRVREALQATLPGFEEATPQAALAAGRFKELGPGFPGHGFQLAAQRLLRVGDADVAQLVLARGERVITVFVAPNDVRFEAGERPYERTRIGTVRGGRMERGPMLCFFWGTPEMHCGFITEAGADDDLAPVLEAFRNAYHPQ